MKLKNVEELCTFVAQNTSGFVGANLEILCQHVLRQYENNNIMMTFAIYLRLEFKKLIQVLCVIILEQ